MPEINCPECENPLKIKSRLRQGQHLTCRRCDASLEVVSLNPLEIDFAEEMDHARAIDRNETVQRRHARQQRDPDDD